MKCPLHYEKCLNWFQPVSSCTDAEPKMVTRNDLSLAPSQLIPIYLFIFKICLIICASIDMPLIFLYFAFSYFITNSYFSCIVQNKQGHMSLPVFASLFVLINRISAWEMSKESFLLSSRDNIFHSSWLKESSGSLGMSSTQRRMWTKLPKFGLYLSFKKKMMLNSGND